MKIKSTIKDFLIKHKSKITRGIDIFVVGVFIYNAYIAMTFAYQALPLVVVMFPWVMNAFLFTIVYWIKKDKEFFDETMDILKQELEYIKELSAQNTKLMEENIELKNKLEKHERD